jgi:hypothetical protein
MPHEHDLSSSNFSEWLVLVGYYCQIDPFRIAAPILLE